MDGNGYTAADSNRVRFGQGDMQTIPAEWVEPLLRLFYERHPAMFGALLGEVVTGERFTRARVKA